jgi:hypothetical protein
MTLHYPHRSSGDTTMGGCYFKDFDIDGRIILK